MAASAARAGRVGWVDLAKGICILLVVAYHVNLDPFPSAAIAALLRPTGVLRMPLFFFVSGLFAGRLLVGDGRWLLRRRVWPWAFPFTLWTVIYLGGMHREGPAAIAAQLVTPTSHMWFLQALIVYSVATWATRRLPRGAVLALAIALALAGPLLWGWSPWNQILRWWPAFLLGMGARELLVGARTGELTRGRLAWWAAGAAALWLLGQLLRGQVTIPAGPAQPPALHAAAQLVWLTRAPAGVALALALAIWLDRRERGPLGALARRLRAIGRRTLAIYLTHIPVDILLEYRLIGSSERLTALGEAAPWAVSIAAFAICLAAARALEALAGNVAWLRWLVYAPELPGSAAPSAPPASPSSATRTS